MNKLYIIFIFIITSTFAYGQPMAVKLTNLKNPNRVVILKEGDRVSYYGHEKNAKLKIGILSGINEESIRVDSTEVPVNEIAAIGRKKSGSGFGGAILIMGGIGMAASALAADDGTPCPQCTTTTTNEGLGTLGDVLLVVGGLTLDGLGIHTVIRNTPRPLKDWTLELIPNE